MARDNENDVTDGAASEENGATRRARERALGTNPLSVDQMADAIHKAQERSRQAEATAKVKPLSDIVRASVRCGYETVHRQMGDGSRQLVTMPAAITFKADETADGREWKVPHGKPVQLKREAFLRYQSDGKVIIAQ